ADNSRQITEARQNAIYGLGIALGELQQLAGPDQRVTAAATVAYPPKGTLTGFYKSRATTAPRKTYLTPAQRDQFDSDVKNWWNGKNPRWTGVWDSSLRRDSSVPSTKFGEPKRDQLPRWLVSGNEGKSPADAGYVTPDTALADPATSPDVVWLVGEGSATSNATSADGLEGRVKAPRIAIAKPDTSGQIVTGHYAYWVGDESVKANFAVHDPYAKDDLTPSTGYEEGTKGYRNRLQVPQRIGWENLSSFAPFFSGSLSTALKPNDTKLGKIVTNAQIPLLDQQFQTPARNSFHQLTAWSRGLLTDTALGGLKKDLSVFLNTGSGLVGSQTVMDASKYTSADPRLGANNSGFPSQAANLPTWSKIKAWNDNSSSGNGPVTVSPEFAPVVTSYRFFLAFTHQNGMIQLHVMPVFTLWNPFDAPLASTTYTLKVRHNFPMWRFGVATAGITDPTDDGIAGFNNSAQDNDGFVQNGYYVHKLSPVGWYANANKYNSDLTHVWDAIVLPWHPTSQGPVNKLSPFDMKDGAGKCPLGSDPNATWVGYTFTTDFAAGESKVVSMRAINGFQKVDPAQLHSGNQTVALAPGFDADFPPSYYFDMAQMVDPSGGSGTIPDATRTVRFYGENFAETNLSYFSMKLFAGSTLLWTNTFMGYKACNQWNGSLTGSGTDPMDPNKWRIMFHLDKFKIEQKNAYSDTTQRSSPIFPWYMGSFTPFTIPGWYLPESQGVLASYTRAFAVTNPSAPDQSLSRELDGGRSPLGEQNSDNFQTTSIFFVESGIKAWDENQSDGTKGFSLITWKKKDTMENLGLSSLPIRNVKRADSEVLSLGQLQQVNLSPKAWQPAFAVGNSEASPWVDRANVAGINSYKVGAGTGTYAPFTQRSAQLFPNNASNDYVDLSYLLNESLWDGFFLSSVPQTGPLTLNNSSPLPNSRHRFRLDASFTESDVRSFDNAAAFLENFGAFDVNSTSVDAWKALFTAFRGLKITGGDGKSNPAATVPVSGNLQPATGPIGFTSSNVTASDIGAAATNRDYSKLFTGFRYLTDDMIDALAKRIVDEVRLRGPFFSLADFVNRRLVAPDASGSAWQNARTANQSTPVSNWPYTGRIAAGYDPVVGLQGINGTLQRALNLSGINGGPNYPFAAANNDRVFYTSSNTTVQPMEQMSDCAWYLDTEHLTGMAAGEIGQLMAHIPGFVTQADLLGMIGPALTARGDTFLVRAYGDAVNATNQKVQTRAWLEAVIQRVPEPVNPDASGSAWQNARTANQST
ncbi:MAG: hypothetical protein WCH98_14800, partial [Verrucomicrobiota bacterium]